jgi:hypothetical protein
MDFEARRSDKAVARLGLGSFGTRAQAGSVYDCSISLAGTTPLEISISTLWRSPWWFVREGYLSSSP